MQLPAIMREGWKWLLLGAEGWGNDWANSVDMYIRYGIIHNFPVRSLFTLSAYHLTLTLVH